MNDDDLNDDEMLNDLSICIVIWITLLDAVESDVAMLDAVIRFISSTAGYW